MTLKIGDKVRITDLKLDDEPLDCFGEILNIGRYPLIDETVDLAFVKFSILGDGYLDYWLFDLDKLELIDA